MIDAIAHYDYHLDTTELCIAYGVDPPDFNSPPALHTEDHTLSGLLSNVATIVMDDSSLLTIDLRNVLFMAGCTNEQTEGVLHERATHLASTRSSPDISPHAAKKQKQETGPRKARMAAMFRACFGLQALPQEQD